MIRKVGIQLVTPFARAIEFTAFARRCTYFESYMLERRSGVESFVLPTLLVGVFDSPLLFALALAIDSFFFSGQLVRPAFPSSIAGFYSLLWFVVVFCIEVAYFRIGERDNKIIEEFARLSDGELEHVRTVSIWYGVSALVGGGLVVSLIW